MSLVAPSPGFCVSPVALFDPTPYARELELYIAALLALMRVPEDPHAEAEALRAFHAEFVAGVRWPPSAAKEAGWPPRAAKEAPAAPSALVVSAEEASQLFDLSLHGIFKHLGSGAICCLLKAEPGVMRFGMPAADDASVLRMRSSWDSVNFLAPEIVDYASSPGSPPAWLHRDARLGAAEDRCWQGLFNISPHAQDGPSGDACFVCIPGSQADAWTDEELLAAGGPAKAEQARKKDWVRAADFGDALTRGRPVERVAVCSGGGVGWDSRLLHSGSLFATAGRPHPRMVKYVYYFRADACPAAARKTHELMIKACTPALPAEGDEAEEALHPLARLPIAPTTPHRGNAKNSTGFLPTFRVTGRKRAQADKLNRLLSHPLVRPFFTLPHAIARGLTLKHGGKGSLVDLALAVMARLAQPDGPGQHEAGAPASAASPACLTPPMLADLDTLRGLHAAPEPRPRKRARA